VPRRKTPLIGSAENTISCPRNGECQFGQAFKILPHDLPTAGCPPLGAILPLNQLRFE
jgi:hypothetical protein